MRLFNLSAGFNSGRRNIELRRKPGPATDKTGALEAHQAGKRGGRIFLDSVSRYQEARSHHVQQQRGVARRDAQPGEHRTLPRSQAFADEGCIYTCRLKHPIHLQGAFALLV